MRQRLSALLISALMIATLGTTVSAAVPTDSTALRSQVNAAEILTHLQEFQDFASANGDTREASTPGFDLSADYVAELMDAAGYTVSRQTFEYNFFEEVAPPVLLGLTPSPFPYTYDDGEEISTMDYSGSGSVTGVVQEADVTVPLPVGAPDGSTSSGCEDADFTGFTGDIALVQRGTCFFFEKVANAIEAGADAVLIFNEGNSDERSSTDFGSASEPQDVPIVELSAAAGAQLVELIRTERAAGRTVTMTVTTSTVSEVRESQNVIADSTFGRTDRVVVSGAHLDSVIEGPGINDNGSGSAAQLEVALELAESGATTRNAVRFIWFGAEEAGLVGSAFYVSELTKREVKNIAVMLNFDMVASPNAGWFVYDGDASDTASTGSAGSGVVEDVFVDFFTSIGRVTKPTAFDGRSDYDAFVAAGIPAGGLFTGAEDFKAADEVAIWGGTAGVAYDPCYHQACDDIDNLHLTALDEMADAMAHGLLTFANTTSAVEGSGKGNGSPAYDPSFKGHKAIR